ncbi:hypothetical protein ACSDRG_00275 [Escherichia coli]
MESANLDLEENKEIASKFERALGMGAALLIKSKVGWSLPNPPGGLS